MKDSAKCRTWTAWGVLWQSRNRLDGERCDLIGSASVMHARELTGCTGSLMFATRRECREFIKEKWSYIRDRPDLRSEPHGWRMPKAVRIKVSVKMFGLTNKQGEAK